MRNRILAIAIPTYKRADILKQNILKMLPEIQKFQIPIYISDDSSDLLTERFVNDLKLIYPLIFYKKNTPALGHDKNCTATLGLPDEEYIWYLGDSVIIKPAGLERVLSILNQKRPDFLCVNAEGRDLELASESVGDVKYIVENLAWHLTMTGATIYKKNSNNFELDVSLYKNFPQLALILNQFEGKSLYWLENKLIYTNPEKVSYWNNEIFSVFLKDYKCMLQNVRPYLGSELIDFAVKNHATKSGIFSLYTLSKMRMNGYDVNQFKNEKKSDILSYTSLNYSLTIILLKIPVNILKKLFKILSFLKKRI